MSAISSRSHRRLAIRWSLVLAAILCAVVIVWLRSHSPNLAAKSRPYVHAGVRGEKVVARNFSVEVRSTSPKLAHAYLTESRQRGAPPFRLGSNGIWVSAVVLVEALEQPGIIDSRLRTRSGWTYPAAGADRPALPGMNLYGTVSSPGLSRSGVFFFELPPDQLEGVHMEMFWQKYAPQPWDSVVDIDLGMDQARVRELLAAAPAELDLRP